MLKNIVLFGVATLCVVSASSAQEKCQFSAHCVRPSMSKVELAQLSPIPTPGAGGLHMVDSSDAQQVRTHLSWCAGNWGVNEGAPQAVDYINAAIATGYSAQVAAVVQFANTIPGLSPNVLKRPPVIDAARGLSFVSPDLAIDLALTCQAHNGGVVRNYLNLHRDLVLSWLRGQL